VYVNALLPLVSFPFTLPPSVDPHLQDHSLSHPCPIVIVIITITIIIILDLGSTNDSWLLELGLLHSSRWSSVHPFSCNWHNFVVLYDWVIFHSAEWPMHEQREKSNCFLIHGLLVN
jgi:hypothetical protein